MKELKDYLFYHEDGPPVIDIYCGDCLEIMPLLPKVDLVVTDPPYGINYNPEGGGKVPKTFTKADMVIGDDKEFDPKPFISLNVKMLLWGANNFAHLLPPSRGWIIWDKKDGLNPNSFSDAEVAWTNLDMPMRIIRHRWSGYNKASEQGIQRVHPKQKPVEVMNHCIGYFEEGSILDPFMGSGTTLISAKELKRNCIGIEINEKYCEIARKRLVNTQVPFL